MLYIKVLFRALDISWKKKDGQLFVQFGLFEGITKFVFDKSPTLQSVQSGVNFSAGLGSGCVATVISFPFDTIRTRLIVQGEPKVTICYYNLPINISNYIDILDL